MDKGRGVIPNQLAYGGIPAGTLAPEHQRAGPTRRCGRRRRATTGALLRRLIRHIGAVRLADLPGDDLDRVQAALADKSASLRHAVAVTANKSLGAPCAGGWWHRRGRAPNRRCRSHVPRPVAWDAEQVRRFLDIAVDDRWAALWLLAATTGARRGELVGLRWADVDLDGRAITR